MCDSPGFFCHRSSQTLHTLERFRKGTSRNLACCKHIFLVYVMFCGRQYHSTIKFYNIFTQVLEQFWPGTNHINSRRCSGIIVWPSLQHEQRNRGKLSDPQLRKNNTRNSCLHKYKGPKIEHKRFVLRLSGCIPAQLSGYPAQKFGYAGFQWTYRTFLAPTPSRGRHPPHRKVSRRKSLSLCSLFLPGTQICNCHCRQLLKIPEGLQGVWKTLEVLRMNG